MDLAARKGDKSREPFCPNFSEMETSLLSHEVDELLNKGAVEKIDFLPDQFLGHLFLRPKKDGSYRPVFNMKVLNQFVQYEKVQDGGRANAVHAIGEKRLDDKNRSQRCLLLPTHSGRTQDSGGRISSYNSGYVHSG